MKRASDWWPAIPVAVAWVLEGWIIVRLIAYQRVYGTGWFVLLPLTLGVLIVGGFALGVALWAYRADYLAVATVTPGLLGAVLWVFSHPYSEMPVLPFVFGALVVTLLGGFVALLLDGRVTELVRGRATLAAVVGTFLVVGAAAGPLAVASTVSPDVAFDVGDVGASRDVSMVRSESCRSLREFRNRSRRQTGRIPNPWDLRRYYRSPVGQPTFGMAMMAGSGSNRPPDRVATPNRQEERVGEPGRLQTGRSTIYYTSGKWSARSTHVVDASDPSSPEVVGHVGFQGRTMLSGETLLKLTRLNYNEEFIAPYDVSAPSDPRRLDWSLSLAGKPALLRVHDGKLYALVNSTERDPLRQANGTCRLHIGRRLRQNGPGAAIGAAIERPTRPVSNPQLFGLVVVDLPSGEIVEQRAFLASGLMTAYMSADGIYVAGGTAPPGRQLYLDYLLSDVSELPPRIERKIRLLYASDLSKETRWRRIRDVLSGWATSVPDREAFVARRIDAWEAYLRADGRNRNLTRTDVLAFELGDRGDVVETDVATLQGMPIRSLRAVEGSGQFSMDEHEGNLRIATSAPSGNATVTDLYVLDDELHTVGRLRGIGNRQEVSAVYYRGDRAYVATYQRRYQRRRLFDPFHVVDLSDPADPVERGKVRLPGASTYLHPLSRDRVVGIGRRDGRVVAVLFDVSDPANPTVADRLELDARWSQIQRTHRAFFNSRRHGAFFLPAGGTGYVISYGDGLTLARTVSLEGRVRRAIRVGDYLYVFGADKLVVLDGDDWTRVTTTSLRGDQRAEVAPRNDRSGLSS